MLKGTIFIVVLAILVAAALVLGPWVDLKPGSGPQNGRSPSQQSSSAAPAINGIDFPQEITANGKEFPGTVHFQDAAGDIVEAKFKVVKAKLFDSFAFNPEIEGETEGSFKFTLFTSYPQRVTLEVILVDAQGNESEPVEFSFEATLSR